MPSIGAAIAHVDATSPSGTIFGIIQGQWGDYVITLYPAEYANETTLKFVGWVS